MSAIAECRGLLLSVIKDSEHELSQREARRGDTWRDYGRDFFAYMEEFSCVVNEAVLLRQLERVQSPVFIDLMSSTDAIASLLIDLRKRDGLGIAVGRSDNRDVYQKRRDESLGVHQVVGGLLQTRTWGEVKRLLGGRKANLIMEDGLGAWEFIPKDKRLYGLMLNRVWTLLSGNGGTVLAEIPNARELINAGVDLAVWRDMLLREGIDFDYANPSKDRGFLRLTKTPSSPARLPLLP